MKIKWTILSLLAAAGLVISGCSSSSDDSSLVLGPDNGNGTGYVEPGPYPDDGTGGMCTIYNQVEPLGDQDCQTCLETNCCAELRNCFDMDPAQACADPSDPACVTCDVLASCEVNCDGDSQCLDGCEAAVEQQIVLQAYDDIISCGAANPDCATYCNIQ
ncbi:MAG: hypothetical protein FWD69_08700 [Polyangiaceae bacterium]|nr:hypothetical protein [Polyangiaceae bacterium]